LSVQHGDLLIEKAEGRSTRGEMLGVSIRKNLRQISLGSFPNVGLRLGCVRSINATGRITKN
jgi:hypothetical protein